MQQYDSFIFDSYNFDPATCRIELRYSLDDELKFAETLQLPPSQDSSPDSQVLNAALFALHLIGGISYYKTCLPKKIEIRSGQLTKDQAKFWNTVYEQGLGEFFFKNKIDFRGLINFPATASDSGSSVTTATRNQKPETNKRALVPLGGGKDSVVAAEILRAAGIDITLFRMGSHPVITELAKKMRLPLLEVDRRLDPLLFKLNTEGALNGHVPITAYLSFLTVVVAVIGGFDWIVMSNERSADEGNVEFMGKEINHQWSKSLEFERAFQNYVKTYITGEVDYFSLLRPWSEMQIAKRFADLAVYHTHATSCNANWKILTKNSLPPRERVGERGGLWCGHCPKCAFVFAIMAPFLPRPTMERIFGKNLFADPSLLSLYRELLGLEGFKPFECVGTPGETKAALLLAQETGEWDNTAVIKMFLKEVLPTIKNWQSLLDDVFTPSKDHSIPPAYQSLLA